MNLSEMQNTQLDKKSWLPLHCMHTSEKHQVFYLRASQRFLRFTLQSSSY